MLVQTSIYLPSWHAQGTASRLAQAETETGRILVCLVANDSAPWPYTLQQGDSASNVYSLVIDVPYSSIVIDNDNDCYDNWQQLPMCYRQVLAEAAELAALTGQHTLLAEVLPEQQARAALLASANNNCISGFYVPASSNYIVASMHKLEFDEQNQP